MTAALTLSALGLRLGEAGRFRRSDGGRWIVGRLARVEPDGSVTLHDPDGAARSLRPDRVQVERPGRRGKLTWRYIDEIATTWEQLDLFPVDLHQSGPAVGRDVPARRVP